MALQTGYYEDPEANTVPYQQLFDDIRNNYGFMDLRGSPELVPRIPESTQSSALAALLLALAQSDSCLCSLGCDLGAGEPGPDREQHVAGGYVQLMATDYRGRTASEYLAFCQFVAQRMESQSETHAWELECMHKWVNLGIDGSHEMTSSVSFWFHANASSAAEAVTSREVLLACLLDALTRREICLFLQERRNADDNE